MNSRLWARRVDCEPGARVFDERRSGSRMSEDTKSEELKSMVACVLKREGALNESNKNVNFYSWPWSSQDGEKIVNTKEVVSSEPNQNSIKIWRGDGELCRFWSGSSRRWHRRVWKRGSDWRMSWGQITRLPLWLRGKSICLQCRRPGFDPWVRKEKEMEMEIATHSSILAWRIPWRNEPGRLHPWGHKELDMTELLHFLSLSTRAICE